VVACVPDSPFLLVIVGNVVASSDRVTSFFFFFFFFFFKLSTDNPTYVVLEGHNPIPSAHK